MNSRTPLLYKTVAQGVLCDHHVQVLTSTIPSLTPTSPPTLTPSPTLVDICTAQLRSGSVNRNIRTEPSDRSDDTVVGVLAFGETFIVQGIHANQQWVIGYEDTASGAQGWIAVGTLITDNCDFSELPVVSDTIFVPSDTPTNDTTNGGSSNGGSSNGGSSNGGSSSGGSSSGGSSNGGSSNGGSSSGGSLNGGSSNGGSSPVPPATPIPSPVPSATPIPSPVPSATPIPSPVSDDDNDGVPNDQDNCSGTASGVQVGSNGCPPDTDGDGFLDVNNDGSPDDLCPNEYDDRRNQNGCPPRGQRQR